jgi:hypothetical protein
VKKIEQLLSQNEEVRTFVRRLRKQSGKKSGGRQGRTASTLFLAAPDRVFDYLFNILP